MPLEISEIGVRIAVQETSGGFSGTGAPAQAQAALTPAQTAEIVERCVREVLSTLRMLEAR